MAKLIDGVGARRPYLGDDHSEYWFMCPGCKYLHTFIEKWGNKTGKNEPQWSFNGNVDAPTFKPSLLYIERDADTNQAVRICHSFVTDGKIRFLEDCTHALAGQTVELSDV